MEMSKPTVGKGGGLYSEGGQLYKEVHGYLKKHKGFPKAKRCKGIIKETGQRCGEHSIGKPVSRSGLCNSCIKNKQIERGEENHRWYEKKRKRDRDIGQGGLATQDPGIFCLPSSDD